MDDVTKVSLRAQRVHRRQRRYVMSQNPYLCLGEALPPERWPYQDSVELENLQDDSQNTFLRQYLSEYVADSGAFQRRFIH